MSRIAGLDFHDVDYLRGRADRIKSIAHVRIADEFATEGHGTDTDPYLDGIQEAIDDIPTVDGLRIGAVFIPPGKVFEIDETINIPDTFRVFELSSRGGLSAGLIRARTNIEMIHNYARFGYFHNLFIEGTAGEPHPSKGIVQYGHTEHLYDNIWIQRCGDLLEMREGWSCSLRSVSLELADNVALLVSQVDGDVTFLDVHNCTLQCGAPGAVVGDHCIKFESYDNHFGRAFIYDNMFGRCNKSSVVLSGIRDSLIHHNKIEDWGLSSVATYDAIRLIDMNDQYPWRSKIDNNYFYPTQASRYYINVETVHSISITNNYGYDIELMTAYINFAQPWHFISTFLQGNHYTHLTNREALPLTFGVIATPFYLYTGVYRILPVGNAAAPVASQEYTVYRDCRILSGDSGNNDCSVEIKDRAGNVIETGTVIGAGATISRWLPPSWTINWGAFTGAAPSVTVAFN